MISNRGTKVYPSAGAITDCVDHWFCRFIATDANEEVSDETIKDLIQKVGSKYSWVHLEKLQEIDGKPGYTKAQGED